MRKIKCPHGVSPKGNCDICYKESRRKYRQSLKYKESWKEYQQSPKYKEYQKKYHQSLKYKEYKKKYMRKYRRLHNSKVFNPAPSAVSPAGKGVKNDRVPAGHSDSSTEKEENL